MYKLQQLNQVANFSVKVKVKDNMAASLASVSSKNTLIIGFCIILSSIVSIASEEGQPTRPFKKIYAFGDSFTDTGNTKSASGPNGFGHVSSSPYGSTFFHHSTNRYSDGRLVIDFVAEAISLPYLPPYLHLKGNDTFGVNFAVGGSTAINHEFFVRNNLSLDITPQSIQTQLLWFNRYLETKGCEGAAAASDCKVDFDDALFWFGEIGVNDYAYTLGSAVSQDIIRELAMASVSRVMETLLQKGAKYMVVQGFPPTGCLPLAMFLTTQDDRDEIGCARSVNNQSYTHNLVLQSKLQELRKNYPNATIIFADYWNAYRTVMKNPKQYGFTEIFKVCCGSGEPPLNFNPLATCGTHNVTGCKTPYQYINWDGVHLTEAMYRVVSSMFLKGSFTQPPFSSFLEQKERQG